MNILQLKAFVDQHNPWQCRAYNTVPQTLTNNNWTTTGLSAIEFDPSGMVTTGVAGFVTIPVDGIYHVAVSSENGNSSVDGNRFVVAIFKNGSEFKRGLDWLSGANGTSTGEASAILYLQAGDKIQGATFIAGAGNLTTTPSSVYSYITVAYLCAA